MLLGVSAWCGTVADNTLYNKNAFESAHVSGDLRRFVQDELMPDRWQEAVLKVYGLLQAWSHEGADIKRLQNIIGELLQRCR
jgi:hypothetical protein